MQTPEQNRGLSHIPASINHPFSHLFATFVRPGFSLSDRFRPKGEICTALLPVSQPTVKRVIIRTRTPSSGNVDGYSSGEAGRPSLLVYSGI